jgi:hypothetical protein
MKMVSNITFDAITLLSNNFFVAVESAWERKRLGFWDCHGEIIGTEPVLQSALCALGIQLNGQGRGKAQQRN